MQGCYNYARLQTPCTICHNLVTTLLQPNKVAARLLQPSYFHMGIYALAICTHLTLIFTYVINALTKLL